MSLDNFRIASPRFGDHEYIVISSTKLQTIEKQKVRKKMAAFFHIILIKKWLNIENGTLFQIFCLDSAFLAFLALLFYQNVIFIGMKNTLKFLMLVNKRGGSRWAWNPKK